MHILMVDHRFPVLEPSVSSVCAPDTIVIDISTSLFDDAHCATYLADPLATNPLQYTN